MKKKFLVALISLFVFSKLSLHSQIDTSFWFAAPWISPDNTPRQDIVMRISTFGASSTTVHLRQPAATAPNKYDTIIVIGPNQTFNYIFWRDKIASGPTNPNIGFDSLEVRPANTVLPYGIYISSSSNISALYDIVCQPPGYGNPETFSLMGKNGLGLEFVCPQQTLYRNIQLSNLANTPAGIMQPKQQIVVVASRSNTTIWITPKCLVVGHASNVSYSVTLPDAGSCYNIENVNQDTYITGNNLSGTEIIADKPIAVTVADDAINNTHSAPAGSGLSTWGGLGCYDLIGDQIVPVNVVGNDYILVRGQLYQQDQVGIGNPGMKESAFIVGTQNNTQLSIVAGGFTTTATLNRGDTYVDTLFSDISYIHADKNIYVYHVSGTGCEMGSALVPPLACAGSSAVAFSRDQPYKFTLNVICKNGAQNTFTLSGNTSLIPASSFTSVPGTSSLPGGPYYAAQVSLQSTVTLPIGSYTLGNSSPDFAIGVLEGNLTSGALYHFSSEFAHPVTVKTGSINPLCISLINTVVLTGTVTGGTQEAIWTSANGTGTFTTYTSSTTLISTTYSLSVSDTLKNNLKFYLISAGGCQPYKDSVILDIHHKPVITLGSNVTLCKNNIAPVALSGTITNALGGIWSGGSGGAIAPGSQATYTLSSADLQTSAIIFTLSSQGPSVGCSNTSKQFTVTLIDSAVVNAGADYLICDKLFPGVMLNGNISGNTTTGIWSGPGTGSFLPSTMSSTVNYLFSNADLLHTSFVFTLSSLNNGLCKGGVDVIKVTRDTTAFITNATSYSICLGGTSTLTAGGVPNFTWSVGSSSSSIVVSPSLSSIYVVTGTTSAGCVRTSSITLQVNALPQINISATPSLVCNGEVAILNASGAQTYSWNSVPVSTSTLAVSPTVTTLYIIEGADSNNCKNINSVSVVVSECTGLSSNLKRTDFITVYPNPSNGKFTIQSNQKINLILINQIGQILKSLELNSENHFQVEVSELAQGIYFVTGNSGGKRVNQKIIIAD